MSFPSTIKISDAHFHFWNTKEIPNENLGDIIQNFPKYDSNNFFDLLSYLPSFSGGVHIETIVGQSDGGIILDEIKETRYIIEECINIKHPINLVAFVQLSKTDCFEKINKHKEIAGEKLVGIRMILNYLPSWPQVDQDFLSGENNIFNGNISKLHDYNLSFDLQCNWHQLYKGAYYFNKFCPNLVIIINHLGCLKFDNNYNYNSIENQNRLLEWKNGLLEFSKNKLVYIKFSMLQYCTPGWMVQGSIDRDMALHIIKYVISIFGVNRIIFGSNTPVELYTTKCNILEIFQSMYNLLNEAGLTNKDEIESIFHYNAIKVYKLNE